MSNETPTPDQPLYPQPQPAAPGAPYSAETDKQLAMWAHIGGVVGFLPSLIIWLMGRTRGPRVDVEAKEALNWQITWEIVYVALWILQAIVLATPLWPVAAVFGLLMFAVWAVNVVFSIIGGLRVNAGGSYRYPINFRFIK